MRAFSMLLSLSMDKDLLKFLVKFTKKAKQKLQRKFIDWRHYN